MCDWVEYTQPKWRNLEMRELDVDQAYLVLKSSFPSEAFLYSLSEECYQCPYTKLEKILTNHTGEPLKINVAEDIRFKVFSKDVGKYDLNNGSPLCSVDAPMLEFGVYNLSVHADGSCELSTDKEGVNVNLSILSVLLLGILLYVVLKVGMCVAKKFIWFYHNEVINPSADDPNRNAAEKRRMKSLDAFRGLAIVLMIFVNSGGGGYWWIEHATWNGLHLADLVFPAFLWIMGVCIPISIKSQLTRGTLRSSMAKRILIRSMKMFIIGICLNSVNGPQIEDLRIMGVLQRFAVAFFVVSLTHTIFAKQQHILPQSPLQHAVADVIAVKEQIVLMLFLTGFSLGIMFGVNAPGCPRGYIGPGGKSDYASHPNCVGGIAGYIDSKVLGESHIYQHATAKRVYESKSFDPEGIFGCLLTIVQVILGVVCGSTLITFVDCRSRLKRWISWGLCLGLLGAVLCLFSKEEGWIPLNKNLWSLSFVLVTSSICFIVFSAFYVLIDVCNIWSGHPFAECGMNAIILYVGHTILHKTLPWHWKIGAMNTHFIRLLECTWNTTLWVVIAIYLNAIQYYYTL